MIEQTVRETLPDGFQRAEYLHAHGIIDMVVKRSEMRETLGRLVGMLRGVRATRRWRPDGSDLHVRLVGTPAAHRLGRSDRRVVFGLLFQLGIQLAT